MKTVRSLLILACVVLPVACDGARISGPEATTSIRQTTHQPSFNTTSSDSTETDRDGGHMIGSGT